MKVGYFFPGFVRKTVSFTMDDGNVRFDRRFINTVKPYGIKGAFNLSGTSRRDGMTDEEYREFYRGYEIANHCKMHPKVLTPEEAKRVTDEPFDRDTANHELIYKTDNPDVFMKKYSSWGYIVTTKKYIELIDEAKRELEEVFGEGSVTDYVWPFCEQQDEKLFEHLKDAGYASIRRTGEVGFDMPADRTRWSYTATHKNLVEKAEAFEALSDDGELKFFCFGVHPHDFEYADCWENLEEFAKKFGNRPETFWYATPREVFEYEDAIKALRISENSVTNPTDKTLYVEIDGERITLPAAYTYTK